MKALKELEKDFRHMNSLLIEEYEQAVKEFKKEEKEKGPMKEQHDIAKKKMLTDAGFDIKKIEREEEKETIAFQKRLAIKRKELINRKPNLFIKSQEKSLYSQILKGDRYSVLTPFGACLMAPDTKLVESVEGERGNPWVFPYDPSQIKIMASGHIGGWTCWQAYGSAPPPTANIWFNFVPDRTGKWDFSAIVAFDGFYVLRSDDSWYNCRNAWVKLKATARVHQYSWQGKKNYTLLSEEESNADYTRLFNSTEWMDTSGVLQAGDITWILVTITLEAMSSGSGTYAELNFQSGTANHILPVLVLANLA
ncbi:MAG: hypothetical protein ABI691_03680 [Ginsengibacter sp.]